MPDFLTNLVRRGAGMVTDAVTVPSAIVFDPFVETAAAEPEPVGLSAKSSITEREVRTHRETRIETKPTETIREVLVRKPMVIPVPPVPASMSVEIEQPLPKFESVRSVPVPIPVRMDPARPFQAQPAIREVANIEAQRQTPLIEIVVPAEPASPTPLPAAVRSHPDEHVTEVHIGSVEVRLSAPAPQFRAATPPAIERAPRRPLPSGFDQYRAVRSYRKPL
jgi:hypothetical protein